MPRGVIDMSEDLITLIVISLLSMLVIFQIYSRYFSMHPKSVIRRLARTYPKLLVRTYEKKTSYTYIEINDILKSNHRNIITIKYATAMFCTKFEFNNSFESSENFEPYDSLRIDISKVCFQSWPWFNFESLLSYSENGGGIGGGDGGGGDGGC